MTYFPTKDNLKQFTTVPTRLFDKPYSELPICTKCNKPVDSIKVEFGIHEIGHYPVTICQSGEIVLTISCHGEKFTVSNWHGRMSDDYRPYGAR